MDLLEREPINNYIHTGDEKHLRGIRLTARRRSDVEHWRTLADHLKQELQRQEKRFKTSPYEVGNSERSVVRQSLVLGLLQHLIGDRNFKKDIGLYSDLKLKAKIKGKK